MGVGVGVDVTVGVGVTVAVAVAVASEFPQVEPVVVAVTLGLVVPPTVTELLEPQPPASVTNTLYVPALKPTAVAVICEAGSSHA